ncbi:MATE family efflux transporter [Anaerosacchariphilus sp. NSJ-68]|uniref:Probable multidrug resistance protein NorM n=2 Tax=Lachnospiraceae TaxID=186803 RepID=A0A923RLX0_9FIRM|nr:MULTISPECIES: MATE family efflux transporter [Lachnospiraceae]MBC5659664.1 MATE family efflux transporter [Anaerosacchariphilus hominis]MBC5697331.1 MATE family efflux transporter [Roseburia difficilis]
MERVKARDFNSGGVMSNILYFSLPYLLSYFLQTLYGMADLFIIGQFDGTEATTAVSLGSQVMHMLTVILVGLAMGTTVSIGQAVGARDQKRASESIGNTVVLFLGISLSLTILLTALVRPIVSLISTPEEAVEGTIRYLTICFLGIPFITAYNVISSIFRGLGDSKSPMYFIAVACSVNIALDYLFMGAFHLGPAGAALGTTLSQTVSVVIALVAICRRDTGLSLGKADLRPEKGTMEQLLRIGLPVALQDGLIQVSFILITIIANRRGLTDAAAVGIVEKIISFVFLVPSSMLSTVSALCAQNIGAGQEERARKTLRYAICMATGFGLFMAVLVQFIANPVVGLFSKDIAVMIQGGWYFRGYIFDCMFAGIHFSFSGYFCACGRSELSFLHNIVSIILVRIPGAYFMSKLFPTSLLPMGLATAAGSLLSVIICVLAYGWLRRQRS